MATLKQRGSRLFAGQEAEVKPADLQTNLPIFLHTALAHDEVVAKHSTFREFLKTSCLAER